MMNFIFYMPVIANTFGKGFHRFIQRADVIASGGLLDEKVLTFKDVAIANLENVLVKETAKAEQSKKDLIELENAIGKPFEHLDKM